MKPILLLLAALLLAASVAPQAARAPLPKFNSPKIMPAEVALYGKDTEWMTLGFLAMDRAGNIKIWGYLQGPVGRATPAVLYTHDGKWMAAVYDSPDLAQTGFWYVGREGSGYVAVFDCEIEGAFGELILARSTDGIRWRPVGVMQKESYTQLFQELGIFDGGRWVISTSSPADQDPAGQDYIYESRDDGRAWRQSRKVPPAPPRWEAMHYYLSPQIAGRGNRVFPVVKLEGKIMNPRYAPESE